MFDYLIASLVPSDDHCPLDWRSITLEGLPKVSRYNHRAQRWESRYIHLKDWPWEYFDEETGQMHPCDTVFKVYQRRGLRDRRRLFELEQEEALLEKTLEHHLKLLKDYVEQVNPGHQFTAEELKTWIKTINPELDPEFIPHFVQKALQTNAVSEESNSYSDNPLKSLQQISESETSSESMDEFEMEHEIEYEMEHEIEFQ